LDNGSKREQLFRYLDAEKQKNILKREEITAAERLLKRESFLIGSLIFYPQHSTAVAWKVDFQVRPRYRKIVFSDRGKLNSETGIINVVPRHEDGRKRVCPDIARCFRVIFGSWNDIDRSNRQVPAQNGEKDLGRRNFLSSKTTCVSVRDIR